MLSLRTPSDRSLQRMTGAWAARQLSYEPGLLHRDPPSRLWFTDRHREVVGHGPADFERACEALRQWAKFRQPWTRPATPLAPIEVGRTVGYTAQVLGVWWSYCCRIVATIDDTNTDAAGVAVRRFGLEYGTLRGHAERGEERFLVEHDPSTDEVTFELYAVSQPGRWFTWIGLPIARRAQAKFRPGAAKAMRDFVTAGKIVNLTAHGEVSQVPLRHCRS